MTETEETKKPDISFTGDAAIDIAALLQRSEDKDLVEIFEKNYLQAAPRDKALSQFAWSQTVINMKLLEALTAEASGDADKRNTVLINILDKLSDQFATATQLVLQVITQQVVKHPGSDEELKK